MSIHRQSNKGWLLAAAVLCGLGARVFADRAGPERAAKLAAPPAASAPASALKRKASLGVALAPNAEDAGARVQAVLPGSPAQQAGIETGDVIVRLDGAKVEAVPPFLQAIGATPAGQTVTLGIRRAGETMTKRITLQERPRERSDEFEIMYDAVDSKAGRLRTLVTRPKAAGKRPALFLIQGLGCFSIENPAGTTAYRRILDDFTRRGYVTLRVDKPGTGDSEGVCRDTDFETELDGYRQALRALKRYPFVDADRIYIFGHSMGGFMGPILAGENPVRGVAVYGTAVKTWYEYALENERRQMRLGGAPYEEIDHVIRQSAAFQHQLFVEGKTPREIAEKHPELRAYIAEAVTDDRYLFGTSYRFFQQLAAKNMPEYWKKVDGQVLAIWGKGDFVAPEADHAMIADMVNRARAGAGTFIALEGSDHGFHRAASQEDSFGRRGKPGEFNPAIIETLRGWMEKEG